MQPFSSLQRRSRSDTMHSMTLRAVLPFLCFSLLSAAEPERSISNGPITAKVYLPAAKDGFYQGKRFDWSGVVYSLTYKGHEYFGPWFDARRPEVNDFKYENGKIVTGAASSITGPAEEYAPIGYDEAAPGGSYIKLGIGALKKPDSKPYDHYREFEFVEAGKWTVTNGPNWITFRHDLTAPNGYGYTYTKTLRLIDGQPKMVIEHTLRNTGKQAIHTTGYNHNFLTLDHKAAGPGYTITTPFNIKLPKSPESDLATVNGKQVVYQKQLQGENRFFTEFSGYSAKPSDYDFRFESKPAGAGMRVTSDQPLTRAVLWSIRSVVSVEPFIRIDVEPGKEMSWKYNYEFFTTP